VGRVRDQLDKPCLIRQSRPKQPIGRLMDKTQIRNASTVIVLRDKLTSPKVLMGQRGENAAFMPSKFVFPGGALDPVDSQVALTTPLAEPCMARLRKDADPDLAEPLVLAALREMWEETGLLLGHPDEAARALAAAQPEDWRSYFEHGVLPGGEGMKFVFRAITPPGRPRRFDARFFLVDADRIVSDLDDFSAASEELGRLQWIPLDEARSFDLPFITEVVLAEVEADLKEPDRNARVPFFYNEEGRSFFARL